MGAAILLLATAVFGGLTLVGLLLSRAPATRRIGRDVAGFFAVFTVIAACGFLYYLLRPAPF